jgi:predicted nicotinamide N-methyase
MTDEVEKVEPALEQDLGRATAQQESRTQCLLGPAQRAMGLWFSRRYIEGGRYACYNETADEKRRSTAAERRTGFDWLLFQLMLRDQARIGAYRRDIFATVPGKRVLEIGPGPAALLSRLCLDAGAASVISVEGDPWVAEQAVRRLLRERQHAGRWRIVPALSTDLAVDDVDGDPHFDVLVLEVYDTIACREHVVETVADLRRRGFSFGAVVSRGFETWVGPSAAPPARPLTRAERLLFGWGAGSVSRVERKLRNLRSTLHGDLDLIESLRLASAKAWQTADFQTIEPAHTEAVLTFDLADAHRYGGFLLHNRFLFRNGVLDTSATSTHWGVYFVPLPLPRNVISDARRVTLRTAVADPARPSSFTLQAEVAGTTSASQSF